MPPSKTTEPVVAPKPVVIDAEGNDPHPERHAVKDVLLDPQYTPAVVDPTRPASEAALESAADVQTGSARAATDKRVDGAPKAADKDAKAEKTQAIRRSSVFSRSSEPSK